MKAIQIIVREGKLFEPASGEIIIGSAPRQAFSSAYVSFLAIKRKTVSCVHARLVYRADQWWVEDLDSTYGTCVNNQRISRATLLRAGDIIRLGAELLEIRFNNEPCWSLVENLVVDEVMPPVDIPEDKNLQVLSAVSQIAAHSLSRSAMLEGFLREVIRAFPGARHCTIMLVEEGELVPRVFWPPERSFASFTLAKKVLRTKQAFSWDRYSTSFPISSSLGRVVHALYAPMLCRGEVVGVIHLDSSSAAFFFQRGSLELLSVIGNTMGPAIKSLQVIQEDEFRRIPMVFISYAREDRTLVDRLTARLRRYRIKVWLDERLKGGESWRLEIATAIERVDALAFIVSPDSIESEEVEREVSFALGFSKPVVPVMLRLARMPEVVREFQCLDLIEDFEEGATKLAERMHELAPKC